MALTYQQAIEALSSGEFTTVESLFSLVKSVSAVVPEATKDTIYLLNSGPMPDGFGTGDVTSLLLDGRHVSVGQSEAGKLLRSSVEFETALNRAIRLELFGDPFYQPLPTAQAEFDAIAEKYYFYKEGKLEGGKFGTFGRRAPNANSLWDIASANYVTEAKGNFRILAPRALDELSVFVQSELPALLAKQDAILVEGMPLSELKTRSFAEVKQLITQRSLASVIATGLSTENITEYLALEPEHLDDWMKDPANAGKLNERIKALGDYLQKLKPEEIEYLKSGRTVVQDITKTAAASSVLKKAIGPVGVLLGLGLASWEAGAAETSGDHDGAVEIMKKWAVEAAGSGIGFWAGGAIAGLGAAALVAGGVLSAPVAGALALGVALLGGFFGGDGALELYELTKDKDNNDNRDIFDKLSNLLLGANYTITTPLPADLLDREHVTLDATFSRDEIVTNAKSDIAWRYALRELNSFVVTGADYTRHNTDGSLDLHDPQTGQAA